MAAVAQESLEAVWRAPSHSWIGFGLPAASGGLDPTVLGLCFNSTGHRLKHIGVEEIHGACSVQAVDPGSLTGLLVLEAWQDSEVGDSGTLRSF